MLDLYLIFVVGAFLSGFILLPAVARRVQPLVSSYPKADTQRRLIAFIIDVSVAVACYAALSSRDFVMAAMVGPIYLLVRDSAFRGQSFGKLFVGLVAVELKTAKPVRTAASLKRNFLFVIPGMNLFALIFEAQQVRADPQGMRLGDRLAQTQVVYGKDAVDLVKAVTDASRQLLKELGGRTAGNRMSQIERHDSADCRAIGLSHNKQLQRTVRD